METAKFGNLRISYREGTCDEKVIEENFKRNIFFKGVPEYRPNPNDIIIDVGAHIGAFSAIAALKAPKGKVYALEPSQETFGYLERNLILNNLSNVFARKLALGAYKGFVKLYSNLDSGNWGNTITKKVSEQYEEVLMDTLANFMHDNHINRCDFMKLNCEGAEFDIILNTPKDALQKIKDILILYHLDMTQGHSENDLIRYLRKCGFFTIIINKSKTRRWIIAGRAPVFCFRAFLHVLKTSIKKCFKPLKAGISKLGKINFRNGQLPLFRTDLK